MASRNLGAVGCNALPTASDARSAQATGVGAGQGVGHPLLLQAVGAHGGGASSWAWRNDPGGAGVAGAEILPPRREKQKVVGDICPLELFHSPKLPLWLQRMFGQAMIAGLLSCFCWVCQDGRRGSWAYPWPLHLPPPRCPAAFPKPLRWHNLTAAFFLALEAQGEGSHPPILVSDLAGSGN